MKEFEFRRMIPEEDGYDVVVAGGGPAGCAAAVTASRMGAKVLLVEALGCLGGAGTSGLVTNMGQLGHGGQMLVIRNTAAADKTNSDFFHYLESPFGLLILFATIQDTPIYYVCQPSSIINKLEMI